MHRASRSEPSHHREGIAVTDGSQFPIVAVRATDPKALDLLATSHLLRERGWIVPAYPLPANAEHITVMRMVIKENFSRDMADMLAHDVRHSVRTLDTARSTGHIRRGPPAVRPPY